MPANSRWDLIRRLRVNHRLLRRSLEAAVAKYGRKLQISSIIKVRKNPSYERLTHCGRVTQICVFNTVKLGTSASSPQCHSTRGNVSRGITPSSTTRVFGEYFLKISVHKNSQRICYKFLKKHSINLIKLQATNVIYIYMEHLFLMSLDHTQRCSTVGRTPLDE